MVKSMDVKEDEAGSEVENTTYKLRLSFPGNFEYISPIRKFIYEALLVNNYNQKFAYRSEVIVDEICTNAITYGCRAIDARIELLCYIFPDRFEVQVKDQGGDRKDIERLRFAVKNFEEYQKSGDSNISKDISEKCLGLEIVRMLSEEIDLQIDDNNVTTLRVVRKRKPYYEAI